MRIHGEKGVIRVKLVEIMKMPPTLKLDKIWKNEGLLGI